MSLRAFRSGLPIIFSTGSNRRRGLLSSRAASSRWRSRGLDPASPDGPGNSRRRRVRRSIASGWSVFEHDTTALAASRVCVPPSRVTSWRHGRPVDVGDYSRVELFPLSTAATRVTAGSLPPHRPPGSVPTSRGETEVRVEHFTPRAVPPPPTPPLGPGRRDREPAKRVAFAARNARRGPQRFGMTVASAARTRPGHSSRRRATRIGVAEQNRVGNRVPSSRSGACGSPRFSMGLRTTNPSKTGARRTGRATCVSTATKSCAFQNAASRSLVCTPRVYGRVVVLVPTGFFHRERRRTPAHV